MFKSLFISLLAFILSLIGIQEIDRGHQEFQSIDLCQMENYSFDHGETIVYRIYYNWNFIWLSAGEVVFRVQDKGDHYKMSVEGRTYPSYEWFFKVRDYFESLVDKETLLPTRSIRDVHEGKYKRYDKIQFDQKNGVATYFWGPNKNDLKKGETTMQNCMHDIVSILYSLRNIELDQIQDGSTLTVDVFLDKEIWPIKIDIIEKNVQKRVKHLGKTSTVHLSPQVIEGTVFKKGDQMNIWVSNDKNKIPLIIESPVSIGSIKAIISNWYGVKHPFDLQKRNNG